jgi:hypothetical protein
MTNSVNVGQRLDIYTLSNTMHTRAVVESPAVAGGISIYRREADAASFRTTACGVASLQTEFTKKSRAEHFKGEVQLEDGLMIDIRCHLKDRPYLSWWDGTVPFKTLSDFSCC